MWFEVPFIARQDVQSFDCHVATSFLKRLKQNETDVSFVAVKELNGPDEVLLRLVGRTDEQTEKDSDRVIVSDSCRFVGSHLMCRLVKDVKSLSKVRIVCPNEEALRTVKEVLEQELPVVCREKEGLRISTEKESINVLVEETSPFFQGVVDANTKVELCCKDQVLDKADSLRLTFRFSIGLLSSLQPRFYCDIKYSSLLRKFYHQWKQFDDYELKETPTEFLVDLLGNADHSNLSSTVVLNNPRLPNTGRYVHFVVAEETQVVLKAFHSNVVEPNCAFAHPTLLQTFCNQKLSAPRLKLVSSDEATVSRASSVQIAFIRTEAHDRLSTARVDAMLEKFFATEKLVLRDGFNVVNDVDGDVVFKVGKVEGPAETGWLVSSEYTSLYQTSSLSIPVPSVTKTCGAVRPLTARHIMDNLPDFLTPLVRQIVPGSPPTLLITPRGSGSDLLLRGVSEQLGYRLIVLEASHLVGETSGATEGKVRQVFATASESSPSILAFRHVGRLSKSREGDVDHRVLQAVKQEIEKLAANVIVVGITEKEEQVDRFMASLLVQRIGINDLDERHRLQTLEWLFQIAGTRRPGSLDLENVARKSAGFVYEDLRELVDQALDSLAERHDPFDEDLDLFEPKLTDSDLATALDRVHAVMADSIGAPTIPAVSWKDVGGLEEAKREIQDTLQMPLLNPRMMASGLRRSGVLMYGPPGVGKTLLAKAVATECALNFLSVKGPELLNMYVGQSEANVREVFARARSASPCVIFFDELDSLAPNRGKSGDSGGVMDRVVSQLLAELDGLNSSGMVFVIGATNRPDLIDPALLRPGRFDRLVYIGVPEDPDEILRILEALTRKFRLATHFRLRDVIAHVPAGLTGADLYALASDAMLRAITRKIERLEAGAEERLEEGAVEVGKADFLEAIQRLVPSVPEKDLLYYKELRASIQQKKS